LYFRLAEFISTKFCQFVATLYPRVFNSLGGFILIFIKMVLIVLQVLIVFTISSFDFTKLNCGYFIVKDEWLPIHRTSVHWIITFGVNDCWSLVTSCNRCQKHLWVSRRAIHVIRVTLPEKAINNAVKDFRKRLTVVDILVIKRDNLHNRHRQLYLV